MGCTARPLTFPLPDNVDPLPVFLDWRLAWSIDRTLPIRSLMRPLFFLPWLSAVAERANVARCSAERCGTLTAHYATLIN